MAQRNRHNPHARKPTSPRDAISEANNAPVLRTAAMETAETDNEPEEEHVRQRFDVPSLETKTTQEKRTKIGYGLRDDFVKDFKQIALDEDRKIYEVMEAALEAYIRDYKLTHPEFRSKSRIQEE